MHLLYDITLAMFRPKEIPFIAIRSSNHEIIQIKKWLCFPNNWRTHPNTHQKIKCATLVHLYDHSDCMVFYFLLSALLLAYRLHIYSLDFGFCKNLPLYFLFHCCQMVCWPNRSEHGSISKPLTAVFSLTLLMSMHIFFFKLLL